MLHAIVAVANAVKVGFVALLTATTTPTPDTVSGILDETTNVVSDILQWVGTIATTIIQTPLLFIGVGLFIMGAAVSFLRRLLRR